jgi:hypothetical protein
MQPKGSGTLNKEAASAFGRWLLPQSLHIGHLSAFICASFAHCRASFTCINTFLYHLGSVSHCFTSLLNPQLLIVCIEI